MNSMIFSYNGTQQNDVPRKTTKLFPFSHQEKRRTIRRPKKQDSNMLFSNNATLKGSMFHRIQYVTSGCSACGK
jgi:hypothetical protein